MSLIQQRRFLRLVASSCENGWKWYWSLTPTATVLGPSAQLTQNIFRCFLSFQFSLSKLRLIHSVLLRCHLWMQEQIHIFVLLCTSCSSIVPSLLFFFLCLKLSLVMCLLHGCAFFYREAWRAGGYQLTCAAWLILSLQIDFYHHSSDQHIQRSNLYRICLSALKLSILLMGDFKFVCTMEPDLEASESVPERYMLYTCTHKTFANSTKAP